MSKYTKKIVIVGSGVSGISAATKLIDNGYPGNLITIIDMGKDPYNRKPSEVMEGFAGAGGFSDGKLTYHHMIGGQLSKYCGKDKAYELMDQSINMWRRFHPDPSKIMYSNPTEEPDFIKPYFGLRLFGVYHIGTDYLHKINKNWYKYLVDNGVDFHWETKVDKIDFENNKLHFHRMWHFEPQDEWVTYDELIFGVGKSGIDFGKQLAEEYDLPTEPKSVQIGVRFEAPQKHFQKLIDISYDFKLYRKFEDKGVSLRSFCTNNNAAYVAVEETYGNYSYNGHAKKDEKYRNDMTNFGIIMELNGIEDPFTWSRNVVKQCQSISEQGLYYSPTRTVSKTSEGDFVEAYQIDKLGMGEVRETFQGYFNYIDEFIEDMKKIFPTLKDDWGIYIPECKYLSPEPLVDYTNLALTKYPNVHFVGDALSARGISVSGGQGIYVAEDILRYE
jgi:uncharacterized FAD-dependent dehydrogenase